MEIYLEKLIVSVFPTPWGRLQVEHNEHLIYRSYFTHNQGPLADHTMTDLIHSELTAYIANPHHCFQLPLKLQGSSFLQKVANELLAIPTGHTLTYGALALQIKSAPRAVGQACKRNPLALFIPCHRVVGKNALGGYMGRPDAVSYKIGLLTHERNPIPF